MCLKQLFKKLMQNNTELFGVVVLRFPNDQKRKLQTVKTVIFEK